MWKAQEEVRPSLGSDMWPRPSDIRHMPSWEIQNWRKKRKITTLPQDSPITAVHTTWTTNIPDHPGLFMEWHWTVGGGHNSHTFLHSHSISSSQDTLWHTVFHEALDSQARGWGNIITQSEGLWKGQLSILCRFSSAPNPRPSLQVSKGSFWVFPSVLEQMDFVLCSALSSRLCWAQGSAPGDQSQPQ